MHREVWGARERLSILGTLFCPEDIPLVACPESARSGIELSIPAHPSQLVL